MEYEYSHNEHFELTNKIFYLNEEEIKIDIANASFPKSLSCLYKFSKKIDDLYASLEHSYNKNDYYIFQIVFRVLLEHIMIAQYIWTITRLNKNDRAGEEYYMNYFIAEFFKRKGYDLSIENIRNKEKRADILSGIKALGENFKDIDQMDLENIYKSGNQFDIRRIGDYLINEVPKDEYFHALHLYMLNFLKAYNKLSSFVHGGPAAEMEYYDVHLESFRKKRLENYFGLAKAATRLVKYDVLTLLLMDNKKYLMILKPLHDFLIKHKE